MTGFLTFSDEMVGTFSWELPEDIQMALEYLSQEERQEAEKEFEERVRAYLHTLIGATKAGGELTLLILGDLADKMRENAEFALELLYSRRGEQH